ncbi:hypothetical protein TNCV_2771991 [Trichonephila clavipes]|nr:hypothetical protein TNCV_2771991 [Trichonephila clavipes]
MRLLLDANDLHISSPPTYDVDFTCVSQDYWDKLKREVEDITRIQFCVATHGRKRLHSALGGIVHRSIGGNRSASPQSFEFPSPGWNVLRTPCNGRTPEVASSLSCLTKAVGGRT